MSDAKFKAQPGPQREFLRRPEDIVLYGGSAGGGKTMGMLMDAWRGMCFAGYRAIIFRRTSPQLIGGGSIWDESQKMFAGYAIPTMTHGRPTWTSTQGGTLEFCHLQHAWDVQDHQSKQYSWIGFDELTQFEESQFWYMISRLRSDSLAVGRYIRAATNPMPDSWVKKLIGWYLDDQGQYPRRDRAGKTRYFKRREDNDELEWADTKAELVQTPDDLERIKSFTFIPASLEDNPALTSKDPGYRGRLLSLPLVDREQLLKGNWSIRPSAGLYFRREYFKILDQVPAHTITREVRAWDKAATAVSERNKDPDWTAGVKLARLRSGGYVVMDVTAIRGTPGDIEKHIRKTAEMDGMSCDVALWQDPGQAGVVDCANMRRVLDGFKLHTERASKSKVVYAGPVSSQAEGGLISLLRGSWIDSFVSELERFPEGKHDDMIDGLSLAHLFLTRNALTLTHGTVDVMSDFGARASPWEV